METVLAQASGVSLRQRGGQLLFVELGTNWMYTAGFVLGLITIIPGIAGVGLLALVPSGRSNLIAGLALFGFALVAGLLLAQLVKTARRRGRASSEELQTLAVLDLNARQLQTAQGQPLASFDQLHFKRRFQFTSSAPALVAVWPTGALPLVSGNTFASGIGPFEDVLTGFGFVLR